MAYLRSSAATSPLGNEGASRSCSSGASIRSSGTVQHNRIRSISTSSLSSAGSSRLPCRVFARRTDGSGTPPQSPSSFTLSIDRVRTRNDRHGNTAAASRRSSLASAISGSGGLQPASPPEHRESKLLDVVEGEDEVARQSMDIVQLADDTLPQPKLQRPVEGLDDLPDDDELESLGSDTEKPKGQEPPFQTYLNHLAKNRHNPPQPIERYLPEDFEGILRAAIKQNKRGHNKSDSQGSSLAFVTTMKSATVTLASASIASVSRRATKWRRGQRRSSLISGSDHRGSLDSQRSVSDEGVRERGRKRRAKLEELIRTEESYVADLKALSNGYFTILGHQPTATSFTRGSAQRTIAEILHLHDDILCALHRAIPFAEYDQRHVPIPPVSHSHNRWHSIDVVPTRQRSVLSKIRQGRRSLNLSRSADEGSAAMRCSPQAVAAVIRVFASNMARFSTYEDYGANYNLVLQDVDETQRSITGWADFDKAIEALSAYINPTRSRETNRKRAMTLKDLLIKPVQRIPRYELLFSDLSTLTPVCDDPSVHAELKDFRATLNMQALCMNEAKDDPTRARKREVTWLIGDRLTFSTCQLPKSVFLQLLGPVSLCGCLHIAYRAGRDSVRGCYVIALLFGSSLLLALSDEDPMRYRVLAGIALANATIEEADNSKGLQCHTAPHSWKLVFEQSAKMYELILTACTAIEASVWRANIASGIDSQTKLVAEGKANVLPLSCPLTTNMQSIGIALGKPASFVRRMPVRAATISAMTDLNQVIIKNTVAAKEAQEYSSKSSLNIPRSQSVSTNHHMPVLAPQRCERHRLENLLSDVWTKDQLPYPGMVRRTDPLRASANSVMRKFSMASITSNFSSSKRNGSHTSMSSWRREDMPPPSRSRASGRDTTNSSVSSRQSKPAVVNFHTAPDAFLPTDFDIPAKNKKKSALRTFTMTIERPFTPLLGNENVQSGVKRAESVRDAVAGAVSRPSWSPAPPPPRQETQVPVYSVVQERAKTPVTLHVKGESDETVVGVSPGRVPRKSKSRLLGKLFG